MGRKSSYSGVGNCIEVSTVEWDPDLVLLRETEPIGSTLITTRANLEAFIKGVKAGEFDEFTASAVVAMPV